MFKSGDKVIYIRKDNILDCRKIYTIYYVFKDFCSVKDSIHLIFSVSDFVALSDYRKKKLIKINESR